MQSPPVFLTCLALAGALAAATPATARGATTRAASPAAATPATKASPPEGVERLAAAVDQSVVAWRRDLHQHPELGNSETRTARLVAEHLRSLGLDVRTGIGKTGVVAIVKGGRPGPRIALRADMDALPVTEQTGLPFASKVTTVYRGETVGVMHACGHDAHTAILMGVAEALVATRAQLPGEVMLVFQPAEEGAPAGETGGASRMMAEGLFQDFKPEAIFGLHVHSTVTAGEIGVRSGPFMAAADSFRILVKGRQTHGARPWLGVDPIVAAADLVGSAQSIVSRRLNISEQPAVLTFGAIRGGNRSNIIPEQVELIGTLRTFDTAMRQQAFDALKGVAEHVAAAHGASVETQIPDVPGIPVNRNDPALTERMLPSLQRAVGADKVREIGRSTGSEDFAFFAAQAPTLFIYVGATPVGTDPATAPANHSPKFFVDERALAVGTRALLQMSLDYLNAGTVP